jgi:iron complex transport system substrate-binding protein
MFFKLFFRSLIFLIILTSCSYEQKNNDLFNEKNNEIKIKYAKHFGIIKNKTSTKIFVIQSNNDTLFYNIDKPFKRLAVLGTIPVYQLKLLNALNLIVSIDDSKYYFNSEIQNLVSQKKVFEVLPNLQWNYETLLLSKPEMIITYSPIDNPKLSEILKSHQIQHILYLDYLEQHPLGRAEWIKLIGCLIQKDSLAEKIFTEIEKEYLELKAMTDTIKNRPSVLTEVMYNDVWYIAGNKSYISQLIKDAGGKYIFDFHQYENSQPYSFEYVLKYAKDADFWIHLHHFQTLQQMKNTTPKYALFKAFQEKRCFNNDKRKNSYSYNDYYESGICQPNLLLKDLIQIFHPELFSNQIELSYYYLLSEK